MDEGESHISACYIAAYFFKGRKSYDGALTNNAYATPPPTPITVHLTTRLSTSLVGELITLEILHNLTSIFKNFGLYNTRLKYLGGFHILIELPFDTNAQSVLSKAATLSCFKNLTPWNENFYLHDRLTWISIKGLPLHMWHESASNQITRAWGKVVFPERCNINNRNLVFGKVCESNEIFKNESYVGSSPSTSNDEDFVKGNNENNMRTKMMICLMIVTTVGTSVKTARGSYYCQYKEVTAAQVEVSAA
nr:RNA-directed DNA polymerase, eukaryota [Tanacetum cinerariifolium]